MKRRMYAYALELKDSPEVIRRYKEYHSAIWPEVLEGLRRFGVVTDNIFLLGNRLFMVFECEGDRSLEELASREQSAREIEWERTMNDLQQQLPWAKEGEWWMEMEKVFDFQEALAAREGGSGE